MRKSLSIFLLFAMVCPYLGSRFYLLVRKREIKQHVQALILDGVEANELVQLTFSKEEIRSKLRWEHDREFEYRSEMYDVVKSDTTAGQVRFWCIWDKAESRLNRQLEALSSLASGADLPVKQCISRLFHFLKSLFVHLPAEAAVALPEADRAVFFYLNLYSSILPASPSPPP